MNSAKASYDSDADTLYLTVRAGTDAHYHEDDAGLVWRLAKDGSVYSVTIMDFDAYWADQMERLVQLIAAPLKLDRRQAAALLHH